MRYHPTDKNWPVARLVEAMPELRGARVLDPCAGEGHLMRSLLDCGVRVVEGVEVHRGRALVALRYGLVESADFFALNPPPRHRRYDAVVMNPPFDVATIASFVDWANGWVLPGGPVIAIFPLEKPGSVGLGPLVEHMEDQMLLEARPFGDEARDCAWHVWRVRPDGCGYTEPPYFRGRRIGGREPRGG